MRPGPQNVGDDAKGIAARTQGFQHVVKCAVEGWWHDREGRSIGLEKRSPDIAVEGRNDGRIERRQDRLHVVIDRHIAMVPDTVEGTHRTVIRPVESGHRHVDSGVRKDAAPRAQSGSPIPLIGARAIHHERAPEVEGHGSNRHASDRERRHRRARARGCFRSPDPAAASG